MMYGVLVALVVQSRKNNSKLEDNIHKGHINKYKIVSYVTNVMQFCFELFGKMSK